MGKILYLNWELHNEENAKEERYCHNCGRKVVFTDSLKRRQNANGKNIYHFAIYKCPGDHSWDKILNIFKTSKGLVNEAKEQDIKESRVDIIMLKDITCSGYNKIVITIDEVSTKIRIDKLLSHQIYDLSRSQIECAIKNGFILIDGQEVKSNVILKRKSTITIDLLSL